MSNIFIRKNNILSEVTVIEAFPFIKEHGHMISIVGGGGKTTLMYSLAKLATIQGKKTIVMTTTRIMEPPVEYQAKTQEEIVTLWEESKYAFIGQKAAEGKWSQPEVEFMKRCFPLADLTLIEADGAKHMPCKVPASHEPVILPECDIVIGVVGLDVIGQKVKDACFRPEDVQQFLNVTEDHIITEQDLGKILTSTSGTKKAVGNRDYYIVLNKCDTDIRRVQGERILRILEEKGEHRGILTSFL